MGSFLILLGVTLVAVGALLNLFPKFHLPGDILIHRGNVTFYVPIVTSLALSLMLTVIVNLLRR